MKKKELSVKEVQELFDSMAIKRSRLEEIDALARKEDRKLNDQEEVEFDRISRELKISQDKVDSWKNMQAPLTQREIKAAEAVLNVVRSISSDQTPEETGLHVEGNRIYLERAAGTTSSTDVQAIQPDSIHELIEPLQKALLVDKLGIKMNTNIVGNRKYPTVNNVEATLEGETTEVAGQKIVFSATSASPKRIAVKVPFSGTSLHQANIDLIAYAIRLMNMAAAQLINKITFSTTKVNSLAPEGCFVTASAADKLVFNYTGDAATTPLSEEDLIDLEIAVMDTELPIDSSAAYVVGVKAFGELKKMRDRVSGEKIFNAGAVNGYPVLVSNHIETNGIGFGVFSNAELNQYGPVEIIVDPYTDSAKHIRNVVFNMLFDLEVVRPEAFAYGKFTKASRAVNHVVVDEVTAVVKTKEQA